MTIAVNLMLYYVILLQKYTRSDPLTGLLNRQSYYADLEKYAETLTAITAIDMNGLKEINDQQGHTAGDAALAALAECFRKAAHRKQRVYRIGGDEFAVLCLSASEEDVRSLTERIRTETAATPYSCSVGYAMRTADTSADDTYCAADAQMYIEKQRFYAETGKQRQKIR
jgi:diguanylate cyclase (GGDEF)-like protein